MENEKAWFCQECQVMMEPNPAGFDKCPQCGAEAWHTGEGAYQQEPPAVMAEKVHGVWYCQRCRVPMVPINADYCKCPSCTAEVWYGARRADTMDDIRRMMEETEDFPHLPHDHGVYSALLGGRPVKGGGGSHNGKGRSKNDLNKPTTTELFRRLCSDS